MSTVWWLSTIVLSAIVGHVAHTRGRRAAIVLASGVILVVGALVAIALVAYGVSRHSRHDGSDIFILIAAFPLLAAFAAWIVFIVARSAGRSGGEPEAIIPAMPARPRQQGTGGPAQAPGPER